MLLQRQVSGTDPAGKAPHGQMKIRIIVFHVRQLFANGNFGIQFLPDFPGKGFLRGFSRFDFPSGELPEILPGAVSPPGREQAARMAENSRNDADRFLPRCSRAVLAMAAFEIQRFPSLPASPAGFILALAGLALGLLCASVHACFGLGLCISEPLYWLALGLLCAREEKRP